MEGEVDEQNLSGHMKESGNGKSVGGSGDGFVDRSKVRILLCDNDAKSSQEVFTLLLKCSYQVTSVRSARQVIDALNAEGPEIDIILSEVDIPMTKGMKMLKYITRDKDLRRIPVIMMSAQDEVSIVVKCLRLGAADYLVKPLRTNELLNLWTHMWRRRHMLGLAEKNILNYDFDHGLSRTPLHRSSHSRWHLLVRLHSRSSRAEGKTGCRSLRWLHLSRESTR